MCLRKTFHAAFQDVLSPSPHRSHFRAPLLAPPSPCGSALGPSIPRSSAITTNVMTLKVLAISESLSPGQQDLSPKLGFLYPHLRHRYLKKFLKPNINDWTDLLSQDLPHRHSLPPHLMTLLSNRLLGSKTLGSHLTLVSLIPTLNPPGHSVGSTFLMWSESDQFSHPCCLASHLMSWPLTMCSHPSRVTT